MKRNLPAERAARGVVDEPETDPVTSAVCENAVDRLMTVLAANLEHLYVPEWPLPAPPRAVCPDCDCLLVPGELCPATCHEWAVRDAARASWNGAWWEVAA